MGRTRKLFRTGYRTTNRSSCNVSVRKPEALLNWVDEGMIWRALCYGLLGHPPLFSALLSSFACQ